MPPSTCATTQHGDGEKRFNRRHSCCDGRGFSLPGTLPGRQNRQCREASGSQDESARWLNPPFLLGLLSATGRREGLQLQASPVRRTSGGPSPVDGTVLHHGRISERDAGQNSRRRYRLWLVEELAGSNRPAIHRPGFPDKARPTEWLHDDSVANDLKTIAAWRIMETAEDEAALRDRLAQSYSKPNRRSSLSCCRPHRCRGSYPGGRVHRRDTS